jgi:hypothetical protein
MTITVTKADGSPLLAPRSPGLRQALRRLRRPGAALVLTYDNKKRQAGRTYCISLSGERVTDAVAQEIIGRHDVRVCDAGLFEDRPQSWMLR